MSNQMPGAFPSTPSSSAKAFDQKTPTAVDFKFTPFSSMSGIKKQLYPNISHLQQSSGKGNEALQREFQDLGYSNTLSTKVLSELNERAAAKAPVSRTGNVLSPRSSRYNTTHRTRFQKMDSISSHYAAARRNKAKLQASTGLDRETIEVDKENIPSYEPHSKRTGVTEMASATKRRRTETGLKEVRSPSKQTLPLSSGQTNLQQILNPVPAPPNKIKEVKTKSSITSLRPLDKKPLRSSPSISNLQRPLPRSTSTTTTSSSSSSLKPHSKPTPSSLRPSTLEKKISRSTTLNNLTRPTTTSLSRSSTAHNLSQTLRQKPSSTSLKEPVSRIPRSKSTVNDKNARPAWR